MSNLSEAISEMRNMRESYNQIAGAAEAYNVGKTQLAQNITSKGVPASANETLPELAEKVSAIAQESYAIQGGEMYAKQLFGSLETPNYWNLYDILAQLLSDGRLVNYGGILLAEYYRSYDSLALSGAGAGGAYVVSDKDENGQFKMYTEDTTHTWATEFDGKGNRWVAYCFADEYHDFQITDTNTSPRSIFIGRKIGNIDLLTNSRTSEVVVPEGSKLRAYLSHSFTSNWNRCTVINVENSASGNLLYNWSNPAGCCFVNIQNAMRDAEIATFSSVSIDTMLIKTTSVFQLRFNGCSLKNLIIDAESFSFGIDNVAHMLYSTSVENLTLLNIESWSGGLNHYQSVGVAKKLTLLYKSNDKTKSVLFWQAYENRATDVELKDGWCKPLSLGNSAFKNLTEPNMYAHILQRLKQDEPDCGDGVTITLGSTNLAKLTSEESVQLLDDLTNIYGYTFA